LQRETPIYKDLDILQQTKKIKVGSEMKKKILTQLKADCDWLAKNQIMDYSLLLGIHKIGKNATSKEILEEGLDLYTEIFSKNDLRKDAKSVMELEKVKENAKVDLLKELRKQSQFEIEKSKKDIQEQELKDSKSIPEPLKETVENLNPKEEVIPQEIQHHGIEEVFGEDEEIGENSQKIAEIEEETIEPSPQKIEEVQKETPKEIKEKFLSEFKEIVQSIEPEVIQTIEPETKDKFSQTPRKKHLSVDFVDTIKKDSHPEIGREPIKQKIEEETIELKEGEQLLEGTKLIVPNIFRLNPDQEDEEIDNDSSDDEYNKPKSKGSLTIVSAPDQRKTLSLRNSVLAIFGRSGGNNGFSDKFLLGKSKNHHEQFILMKNMGSSGSEFQKIHGGILSEELEDGTREIYFFGIIDLLQKWNSKKQLENLFKGIVDDKKKISAVNPSLYGKRFYEFIEDLLE
jgi:hypothetical protein